MKEAMFAEYWVYATCFSSGIPWIVRAVIDDGTRLESPLRLKSGVVLSLPTMLRAVWMVAMVLGCGCMSGWFASLDFTFQCSPFQAMLSHTSLPFCQPCLGCQYLRSSDCVCHKRDATLHSLLVLDLGLPSSYRTVHCPANDIESTAPSTEGTSQLVSNTISPPSWINPAK
jgi:hypothetical protein